MLMLMMAYSPLLVLAVLLVGSNAADNPCETIASNTKVAQEGIRCIGRVGDDLLVMTQKMEIWMIEAKEIDKEGENKPINSLYFGNAPPVPIEEKWPEIKSWDLGVNNSDWNDLKRYTKTCNPAVDANGQYLLIDGPKDQKDDTEHNGHLWIWVEGLRWDIRKKVPHRGFTNDHDDVHARWISSSEPAKQYMFTDKDGKIRVIRYSSCNSSSNSTLDVFLDGPPMGYVNEEGKCYHVKDPPYHPLCLSGTNQVYVGPGSGDCPAGDKPAQWTIFTGFVDKGHFYLMTKDSVISFPETAYNKKEKSAFANIPYGSFIKCSANPHPRDVGAGKKKALTIGLIVALALILLICCLCILLCLAREAIARQKKKDKKGGKGSKGKGGFFGGGTARSGGLLTPGNLSKKFSAVSKRSTGGLTPGRKLTGAGGGSMRTKRSAGPSKAGKAISRKGLSRTRRSQGPSTSSSSKRRLTAVGGGPSRAVTGRSKMTRVGGGGSAGGGGGGPSRAVTGRSRMTRASKRRSQSKRKSSRGASNKATERSRLKNR